MPSVSSETMLCIRSDRFRAPGGNCVGHGAGAKCWVVKAGLGMYSPWHEWYIVSYNVSELTLSTLCCVMLEQLYARMRHRHVRYKRFVL
jgi:hypothetical protein